LGTKSGAQLWGYAHSKDDRCVDAPKARKSIGAEVNWGIRFEGGHPRQLQRGVTRPVLGGVPQETFLT